MRLLSLLSRPHLLVVGAIATLVLALSPLAVRADNYYNNGAYGSDVYNGSSTSSGADSSSGASSASGSSSGSSASTSTSPASSSDSVESTVVETPTGLEVAINLADGQVIPSSGYYITITPLNGQGKTFDKAEIYLDGELVFSGTPDSTGTLKWLWDTANSTATKVKIVVFGPGSGTTTKEFIVSVAPAETPVTQNPTATEDTTTPETSAGWPLWVFIAGILVLLAIIAIIIAIIRRRSQGPGSAQPPTFTPMQ